MAHAVILPRQGQSVESCIITQWHKKVGDSVQEGEVLFSYETDKASFEETAKAGGSLLAIFFEEDDDVPVLSTVALIGQPGEDISGFRPDTPQAQQAADPPAAAPAAPIAPAAPAAPVAPTAPPPAPEAAVVRGVSPRARMTAQRLGVDPATAEATGPQGRVIERDIFAAASAPKAAQAAPAQPPAPAAASGLGFSDQPLSKVRRLIAATMHQSLSGMAQLTHHSSFDATRLLSLRARFKSAPQELGLNDISMNDLILFAVARVLQNHPDLKAHLLENHIRRFDHAHLGLAVDTPRGLLVPTLFEADRKGIRQLSREAKALIEAAQGGAISPDLLQGAAFTVTNLGALGVESFTPIINPPQVAILGVCAIVQRVRETAGQLSAYPAMGLSLTYDHRAVDGAPASRFLKDLVGALEQIDLMLLGQEETNEP